MNGMYDMELNDEFHIGENTYIMRVPGGWIYTLETETYNGEYSISSVFVPYDNEFQPNN